MGRGARGAGRVAGSRRLGGPCPPPLPGGSRGARAGPRRPLCDLGPTRALSEPAAVGTAARPAPGTPLRSRPPGRRDGAREPGRAGAPVSGAGQGEPDGSARETRLRARRGRCLPRAAPRGPPGPAGRARGRDPRARPARRRSAPGAGGVPDRPPRGARAAPGSFARCGQQGAAGATGATGAGRARTARERGGSLTPSAGAGGAVGGGAAGGRGGGAAGGRGAGAGVLRGAGTWRLQDGAGSSEEFGPGAGRARSVCVGVCGPPRAVGPRRGRRGARGGRPGDARVGARPALAADGWSPGLPRFRPTKGSGLKCRFWERHWLFFFYFSVFCPLAIFRDPHDFSVSKARDVAARWPLLLHFCGNAPHWPVATCR